MIERYCDNAPCIADDAFIHASAVVIGDVTIGARSSVWPNTTLRGDDGPIVIGNDTSIQDNSVVHLTLKLSRTVIGSRVTVGHGAILHGCSVEDDCIIGMGSIVLDNAVIERGSIVGAGTVIPPGKRVPPGSLVVGNPFRVVRPCRDDEVRWIETSWKIYVERARTYLERARTR